MPCKDCRGHVHDIGTRVLDSRRLYQPPTRITNAGRSGQEISCLTNPKCGSTYLTCAGPGCLADCRRRTCCNEPYKNYWSKNCVPSCLSIYENQPWYRDPLIRNEWNDFVGDLVTPDNIHCFVQPGQDEYQYNCHKVRGLFGPQVCCTWDLPEQSECGTIRYGYNRDWRRYNEDQRKQFSDFKCGCSGEPVCPTEKCCEWPPYTGKPYGGRYMAWAHPRSLMFPRNRPFHWQSLPKVC